MNIVEQTEKEVKEMCDNVKADVEAITGNKEEQEEKEEEDDEEDTSEDSE